MKFICVTGIPGTGKTFFSLKLAEKLDAKYINLNTIIKSEHLVRNGKNESIIVDLNDLKKKVNLYCSNITTSYSILDGHLSHLLKLTKIKVIFVLRCNPIKLKKRLEKRGYSNSKIRENVLAEILDTCLIESLRFNEDKVCELNTSNNDLDETIKYALKIINGETNPNYGYIDWISYLESHNLLDKYVEWKF